MPGDSQYQKAIRRQERARLLGEKLINFADAAERYPEFAAELPRFQAAVWNLFNPYELAGYLSSLKPASRKKLRELLYVDSLSKSRRTG